MKFFNIFLFLSFFTQINAQKFCGTIDTDIDTWIAQMEAMGGRPTKGYLQTRSTVYIPMHYHIVTKTDKTGGFPLNYLFELNCDLNARYAAGGIDIKFYIDTISYINSSTLYDMTNAEESQINKFKTLKHCNVFLVNDPAGACGYTYRPNTFNSPTNRSGIYLAASAGSINCTKPGSTTLTHEMGHWLDLPHTFYGWEGQTYTSATSPSGIRRENVARTGTNANCTKNGDGFCDTDPDYISDRWTCPNSKLYTDMVGATFTHSSNNYMCYALDNCMSLFTDLQKAQINFSMSKYNERKDLLNIPVPNDLKNDSFYFYYPKTQSNSSVRFPSNNLKLQFNKQPNAKMYNVTLAKGTTAINTNFDFAPTSIIIDTIVTDTFLNILPTVFGSGTNNNYYYWKVRAVNKKYSCYESLSPFQIFRVANLNIDFNVTDVKCHGDNDGKIVINNNSGLTNLKFYQNSIIIAGDSIENLSGSINEIEVKKTDNSVVKYVVPVYEPEILNGTIATDTNNITEVFPTGGTPPYTYTWSHGKTTKKISEAPGIYKVTITDINECKSNELKVTVVLNAHNSIVNSSKNNLQVYPTIISKSDILTILLHQNASALNISLYNILGVKVAHTTFINPSNKIDFPIELNSTGLHLLECEIDGIKSQYKIVVK